jgi:hypothetical protein
MEKKIKKEKTITLDELGQIMDDTAVEATLKFWQKASEYHNGLLKNLKDAGYKL